MPKKGTTKRRMGQCTYYRRDGWCAKLDQKCRHRGRKSDCRAVGTKKRPVFVR